MSQLESAREAGRALSPLVLTELPHYAKGPRDAAGRLWGKDLPLLPLTELVSLFDAWVGRYNRERPHEGLDGQTPLDRWLEDASPLRLIPAAELRWTLLGDVERKVVTSGIRFHGLDFIAPELNGMVGETVQVRYRPRDDTRIEVFRKGVHLCTALPQGTLGPEEREAVLARRRADAAAQARRQRRAVRQTRRRIAPATATSGPEDLTVIRAEPGQTAPRTSLEATGGVARLDLILTGATRA